MLLNLDTRRRLVINFINQWLDIRDRTPDVSWISAWMSSRI
jgi:hypothetical protein